MSESVFDAYKWAEEELRWNEYMTETLTSAVDLLGALNCGELRISKCIVSRDTREVKIYFTDDFQVYKGVCGPWKFTKNGEIIEAFNQASHMAQFIKPFMKGVSRGR